MGNIVLLDDLTINQIAAGEVIERPVNVVKELVENSIDAGAKNIIIEIKKGGKELIKVVDDGSGIEEDDLIISIERHATSKIRKIEDLEQTYTMGFRGEALASIASISALSIMSKTNQMQTGIKINAIAGNIQGGEEVSCNCGTTIIVENLFFNTPVRYKFLKQDSTEFRYIREWIEKVALANLDISFKLISEGKNVFSSDGNGKIENIIYNLYGRDIQRNLVEVNFEEDDIKVTGVIGNTMIARDTRKDQIVFLNKRNIRNTIISNVLEQVFKGSVGIGKFGFCILNLEMPASFYDVNVHPTKMEVRFKEEEKISKVLYAAVKNAMLNASFLGNTDITNKSNYIDDEFKFLADDYENLAQKDLIKRDGKRNIEYKFVGIVFKTYIIIEINNELFFIDQHAAHERVLYEQIKENYKNNLQNNTQMMLVPEILNLNNREMDFIIHNKRFFTNVGFDIELFGKNAVKINGIPDLEYRAKTNKLFLDILDEMVMSSRTIIKDIEERFIATVACKAAVKAGMTLTKEEVDSLIQSLLMLNNPYTCPHGRPTNIKIDLK